MDKSDTETHDFMNVDSFSQLPFIRPSPPLKEKPIKLFGIEFPNANDATDNNHNNNAFDLDNSKDGAVDSVESSRRFECHYCCRNFPTSQALGGHQNAHKRERQHAKRAHLQSAMVHNMNTLSVDAHIYGLVNYRLGSAPAHPQPQRMPYPTWHPPRESSASARLYGIGSHAASASASASYSYSTPQPQPINGSPLALWRIPTVQSNPTAFNRDRSLPSLAGDQINVRASHLVGSPSQNRFVYDSKPSVQDHLQSV